MKASITGTLTLNGIFTALKNFHLVFTVYKIEVNTLLNDYCIHVYGEK